MKLIQNAFFFVVGGGYGGFHGGGFHGGGFRGGWGRGYGWGGGFGGGFYRPIYRPYSFGFGFGSPYYGGTVSILYKMSPFHRFFILNSLFYNFRILLTFVTLHFKTSNYKVTGHIPLYLFMYLKMNKQNIYKQTYSSFYLLVRKIEYIGRLTWKKSIHSIKCLFHSKTEE